jgi:hypothetical protein
VRIFFKYHHTVAEILLSKPLKCLPANLLTSQESSHFKHFFTMKKYLLIFAFLSMHAMAHSQAVRDHFVVEQGSLRFDFVAQEHTIGSLDSILHLNLKGIYFLLLSTKHGGPTYFYTLSYKDAEFNIYPIYPDDFFDIPLYAREHEEIIALTKKMKVNYFYVETSDHLRHYNGHIKVVGNKVSVKSD